MNWRRGTYSYVYVISICEKLFIYQEMYVATHQHHIISRVRLNKRRKRAGAGPQANTRLVVKHRLMNDQEERAHVSWS